MVHPRRSATVTVRLQPRSSRPGPRSFRGGVLELRVSSPPVEGRANEEARRLLADLLGVAKGAVALKRGEKSRSKVFVVAGLTAPQLEERLSGLAEKP